jgi:leucyl aminopeptidase
MSYNSISEKMQRKAVESGIEFAKRIGLAPANIMTPTKLSEEAKTLHKDIKVKVLGEKDMEKLGMGLLLGVSQGSDEEAKLIVAEYNGGSKGDNPTVLIGKGLTFDMGGNSIKPAKNLHQMKFDMLGGGAVLAAIKAAAELKLAINVVAIVPASENLINGRATKPGDVHTSMSGLTVDVRNTDAEGRLILADALTYAQQKFPTARSTTTVATLTGAQLYATGTTHSALLGNDQELLDELFDASVASGDLAWQLPFVQEHSDQMKGQEGVSDLKNIASKPGPGTITAFAFLEAFAESIPYTHLDIASTASDGDKVTGRPIGLLVEFLVSRS